MNSTVSYDLEPTKGADPAVPVQVTMTTGKDYTLLRKGTPLTFVNAASPTKGIFDMTRTKSLAMASIIRFRYAFIFWGEGSF